CAKAADGGNLYW
nr:immunoglobulin heavy chain junction region [Macaca mulatta]MOY28977.1 immunoglobulin heavy chain junction region [Macaca mulatta]MOY29443.1 immunoglobulin heavy chain junction region [Macaca mulatta]